MDDLAAALRHAHPELEAVREAAEETVYLVGGAVRDLLLGRPRADVDLVVEGDAATLATRLGGAEKEHERFGTVKVEVEGHELDIATARRESYPQPGSLPTVEPGATIKEDLARRDFTVNAMAIPLGEPGRLIDPYGGREDLEREQLRVLHEESFVDDPTRAIRAARYAARFGFGLEPRTEELLKRTQMQTVSDDRRDNELRRLAGEPAGPRGFELLGQWGLLFSERPEPIDLAKRALELLATPAWEGSASPTAAVFAATQGPEGHEALLAAQNPSSASEAVELASGHSQLELLLARAMGAGWLDRYQQEWRSVELEIDGDDLIAAGISQGPAVGIGLAAARRAKLDGEIEGRGQELQVALRAAHGD
jgi:tRNA nucleotidyltransferase (CCA-adding enzyme)